MAMHNRPGRSPEAAAEREQETLDNVARKIAANVQVIVLPFSLEEYSQATRDSETMIKFDKLCDRLMSKDSQCVSARFVDRNHKTIFVYLGRRIKTATPPVSEMIKLGVTSQIGQLTQWLSRQLGRTISIKTEQLPIGTKY
jgi:hypothetical protein